MSRLLLIVSLCLAHYWAIANPPSHDLFNDLLEKHVDGFGKVDYKGIKTDQASLDAYLSILATEIPQEDWTRSEQLAYWINAYNAFTIKLIVDHYPVKSIKDIYGGNPWDKKWIKLGGKTYSLNNIEHDIIRPQFKDPRIHFAVNCAAVSCPPLYHKAYTADEVDNQLEQRTKAFIADPTYNHISEDRAEISKIFRWYGEDFDDVEAYLSRYTIFKSGGKIKYLSYNWDLNTQ